MRLLFMVQYGTGKTTKLLNIMEEALDKGVEPERIAFLSFTKKFAQEQLTELV